VHVARHAGDIQGLAAIVTLDINEIISGAALASSIRRPTRRAACRPNEMSDHHVGQFFLEQLGLGQRAVELLAVEAVLAGGVPGTNSAAASTPQPMPLAGAVEAAERALQPLDIRQQIALRRFRPHPSRSRR